MEGNVPGEALDALMQSLFGPAYTKELGNGYYQHIWEPKRGGCGKP